MRHEENHMCHEEKSMRLHAACIAPLRWAFVWVWSCWSGGPKSAQTGTSRHLGATFGSRPRLTGSWMGSG